MKFYKKLSYCLIIILLATSCNKIKIFLKETPTGSEFDKNLTIFYQDFVRDQAKKGHIKRATKFAIKGFKLLYGDYIFSEDPKLNNINDELLPELLKARTNIESLLDNENLLEEKPIIAAKAMYSFDCWVEEQADNWNQDDIKTCKDNFYLAVNELNQHLENKTRHVIEKQLEQKFDVREKQIELANEQAKIIHNLSVHFANNQHIIDDNGLELLNSLKNQLKTLAKTDDWKITLYGHTDNIGSASYNLKLAEKRAKEVKKYLKKLGYKSEKIQIIEVKSRTKLRAKKTSNPKNRRVEIIFSGY